MSGFFSTQKVLCLYVDNGLSFAVQLKSYKKNPVVEKCFVIDTPFDTVSENGCVKVSDIFVENFRLACKQNNITADSVVFSVDTGRMLNRDIVIPAISPSKIDALLQANSSDYFPIDVSNYKMVYRILETFTSNSGKNMRLSVCAIPLDIIISYYALAAALRLKIKMIDYAGNSVFQFVKSYDKNFSAQGENSNTVNVYLSLSSSGTTINFVKDGVEKLHRYISIGYGRLLKNACEAYEQTASALSSFPNGLSEGKVFNIDDFVSDGCIAKTVQKDLFKCKKENKYSTKENPDHYTWEESISFDGTGATVKSGASIDTGFNDQKHSEGDVPADYENKQSREQTKSDGMELFGSALIRSLDYFSNFPENANSDFKIYLLGFGCCFEGMDKLISEKIGMNVEKISVNGDIKNIAISKNDPSTSRTPVFSVCIGSVIQPINFTDKRAELAVPAIEVFKDSGFQSLLMLVGGAVFAICVAASVCLWFIPQSRNTGLKNQYAELNDKIKELSSSKVYFDEHEKWMNIYKEISEINSLLYTKNDKLVYFIEEFERKMPSSFRTSQINIAEDGVSMTITVDSRYEAAYVIMTLREMKSIELTYISNSFTFGDLSISDDDFVTVTDAQYELIKESLEDIDWLTYDFTQLLAQQELFNYFGISVEDYINKDGTLNHKNLDGRFDTLSDEDIRIGLDDQSINFFELFRIRKSSEVEPDASSGTGVNISVSMKYTGEFEIPTSADNTAAQPQE